MDIIFHPAKLLKIFYLTNFFCVNFLYFPIFFRDKAKKNPIGILLCILHELYLRFLATFLDCLLEVEE